MRWGLYDTVDDCWLGRPEDSLPKTFGSEDEVNGRPLGDNARNVARIAAEIAARRAGWPPTRVIAKEFPAGPWREKDEIPLTSDTLTILRDIERGKLV